jgi:hypothetical protein
MSSYDYRFEHYVLVAMHALIVSQEYAKKEGSAAIDPMPSCTKAIQYAETLIELLKARDAQT